MRGKLLLIGLVLGGCATNPATGVASNGKPLLIKDESGTGTYVSNEVVSEDAIVDSEGNDTGLKVQHRADVQRTYAWRHWGYYQGQDKLDEQDYYRIAGDQRAADKIASARKSGVIRQSIGAPLMVAGLAAGGVIAYPGVIEDNDTKKWAAVGAGVVSLVGLFVFYSGWSAVKEQHHLSQERAIRRADLVQTCVEQKCSVERGGRKPPELTSEEASQLRPPPIARPGKVKSVIGRWRGELTMKVTGATTDERSAMRVFEIESVDDETVAFIGDPDARTDCSYKATLDGRKRATFEAGMKCKEERDGVEMVSTVRPGSTIELEGANVLVHLELDVKSSRPGKRSPKRMTVVLDATGRPHD